MKKSIYCVGQKVIFESAYKGRLSGVVKHVDDNGSMYLTLSDNTGQFTNPNDSRVSPVEHFLDPTSFLYHHARFGEFQARVIESFNWYMFAHNELSTFDDSTPAKIRDFVQKDADQQAEAYAAAVELRDLAKMNMAQWGRETLDHHFPFISLENVDIESYHKG